MSTSFEYDAELARKQEQIAKTRDMVAQRAALHLTLNLQPGEDVLDVGSGNGIMAREMAESVGAGGTVTGADASDVQVLCFVPDVGAALSEMHRVTKPGGRIVILESDWDSLVWNCTDQVLMDKMISLFEGRLFRPLSAANALKPADANWI